MTVVELIDYIVRGGFAVALLFILYGGYKGWWVYGPHHREAMADKERQIAELRISKNRLRREKDAWMQTTLRSAGVAFALASERKEQDDVA